MPLYTIEQIQGKVSCASEAYNASASSGERIAAVSLFGSYADGRATRDSDVDLLVRFTSPVVSLFTLAKVLACMEERLGLPVDVVQEPIPDESLLVVDKVVPLYEGI